MCHHAASFPTSVSSHTSLLPSDSTTKQSCQQSLLREHAASNPHAIVTVNGQPCSPAPRLSLDRQRTVFVAFRQTVQAHTTSNMLAQTLLRCGFSITDAAPPRTHMGWRQPHSYTYKPFIQASTNPYKRG